jgi:hypothetical protein
MLQGVCRGVRRTKDLDVEGGEKRARRVLRARQPFLEMVVDPLRVLPRGFLRNTEQVDELVGEPEARRSRAEEVEILAEALPDPSVIFFHGSILDRRHPEILHRDTLTVEHPEDVVVRDDKQLGRSTEGGLRVCEQRGRYVAVRPEYRETLDLSIETPGHGTSGRVRIEEPVRIERPGRIHEVPPRAKGTRCRRKCLSRSAA